MAESFYKALDNSNDVVSTRTLLHEAIPLTGSIVSGTYSDENIKSYGHGMFQSIYDYPYLSSSANHIFDITVGVGASSALTVASQATKKQNIYNQMAQVMMGYDVTGSILRFDDDGDLVSGGTKIDNAIFLNFARLLSKDEIKKGSFQLDLGVKQAHSYVKTVFDDNRILIKDISGSNGYLVNSPVGEYGILYATGSLGTETITGSAVDQNGRVKCGLIFYQAGICVLTSSVFGSLLSTACQFDGPSSTIEGFDAVLTGSTIDVAANMFRNRMYSLQFNNTVELNSTIYFCRIGHNEYNYSTNPTYLSGSKIRVKTNTSDMPISYITTIGLYSDNNELLAVAKLSEPLKKTNNTEFTIRTRLDY